jgi:hypothetical protein
MLHFLRKIRRSLVNSGSGRKYTLYAIGEIALVVIGILIALQINNWNESQKEKKHEKKILIDFREEIQSNKLKLINSINKREKLFQPVDRYMDLMSENKVTFNDFKELHKKDFFSGIISPSFGVLNSIISSGSINYISNDSLKYMLTEWKDTWTTFSTLEEGTFQGHRRFAEYFNKKYPWAENRYHNYSEKDLENRFNNIVIDVEYGNRLKTIHIHLDANIRWGQNLIEEIDGMTHLINEELKK